MAEKVEPQVRFQRPQSLAAVPTHYCPGCIHGIVHWLIAEVIDELEIADQVIGIAPVGCSVLAYNYFNVDFAEAAHGRAPAMATGMKRVRPENIVFTYQGDGDLASIGTNEIVHAATRGEHITVFFINNAVYGMTGGQMAPTTLPGMVTTSSPFGRDVELQGFPLRVSEMLATLDGAGYIVRRSATTPKQINQLKKAIRTAFKVQMAELGFSMVEIVSNCPTNWGMTPLESLKFVQEQMIPYYPLGDHKVTDEVKQLK